MMLEVAVCAQIWWIISDDPLGPGTGISPRELDTVAVTIRQDPSSSSSTSIDIRMPSNRSGAGPGWNMSLDSILVDGTSSSFKLRHILRAVHRCYDTPLTAEDIDAMLIISRHDTWNYLADALISVQAGVVVTRAHIMGDLCLYEGMHVDGDDPGRIQIVLGSHG